MHFFDKVKSRKFQELKKFTCQCFGIQLDSIQLNSIRFDSIELNSMWSKNGDEKQLFDHIKRYN